jgi:hypothetical protein
MKDKPVTTRFEEWLKDHYAQAKVRYDEVCKLDDAENAQNGSSAYYEQAHQMFGYIAALEKCLKEAKRLSAKSSSPKRSAET